MEDPCYPGASQALRVAGAKIIPIPVDRDGLDVAAGRKLYPQARLAYVTPSNQFPLGVTMSANRRMELLNWAASSGAWIIEDEYDAEYRYSGRPVAALQSLDQSGCVIYVGTFTKMLFNALRLGFIIVPERLLDALVAARTYVDRHPPTLDQAILAEFITEGYFGQHVRRMRQIYSERMTVLKEASQKHLRGLLDVTDASAGMRTIAWIKTDISDTEAARRAKSLGLETVPLSMFTLKYHQKPALILGFAGSNPGELRRGVSILATALRSNAIEP
jgi:GntR family transcriptional regulator/MocR family aminotransferase